MLKVKKQRVSLKGGRVGLISDTHGLLRPEALTALKGSELIIHAGDIGKPEVLALLKSVAPVLAVRGNNDREAWAKKVPDILNLEINGIELHVIHNVNDLDENPNAAGIRAVISGHSHKPSVAKRDGVLFVNPGSAGPRRFNLPVTIARLEIRCGSLRSEILELL